MSSCESYIKHRWSIDLDSEDMDTLRAMLSLALNSTGSGPPSRQWEKLRNLIECIE